MTKKHFEALINRFSDVERLAKEGGESGGGGHILAFLLKIIVTNLKKKPFSLLSHLLYTVQSSSLLINFLFFFADMAMTKTFFFPVMKIFAFSNLDRCK